MDLDEFRSFISDSGVDVWTWIDMAISVASADHEIELRNRRDGIIQKLYAQPLISGCENCAKKNEKNQSNLQNHDVGFGCNSKGMELGKNATPIEEEEEDDDDDEGDEQRKILEIKNLIDDHSQSEKSLIGLLQRLMGMNTTFKALKETEIGRHVTKLRKHSSNEVRVLVKILVRKWKGTVDEWVRQDTSREEATEFNGGRNLPDARIHNGVKAVSCYSTKPKRKAKDSGIELNNVDDYQESQHANKQRRPQVMDISKIKNSINVPNNGDSVPIKYW